MAKRDDIEERLDRLAALRREEDAETVRRELQKALAQKRSGLLVAKAAQLVRELGVDGLVPEMVETFHRMCPDPIKRDKGCLGKTEIARTLAEQELPQAGVFLAGLTFVQMEPSWGPPVDAAAQLRGWCAHGLIRMRHPRAVLEVAPLLLDSERPTRLAAADALGDSGQEAAEVALRLKALVGDEDPEVIGECFHSLLRMAPESSFDFVGGFLDPGAPEVAEAAALALGQSRLERAVDLLTEHLERTVHRPELTKAFHLALALTRRDRAVEMLVETVLDGPVGRARSALAALALHAHDSSLVERLRPAVKDRADRKLDEIWRREFP